MKYTTLTLILLVAFVKGIAQPTLSKKELEERISAKQLATLKHLNDVSSHKSAAVAALPEQDCSNAIPICQNVYNTAASYSGIGLQDEIPGNTCLGSNELNSVWYTFTSNTAGNLAFQISPNNPSDDYDFALYDITNGNCSGISSGAITPIRCNYSANPGSTGLSAAGTNANEDAGGSNQSSRYPTVVGRTYVLIISNFSSTQDGYRLDFSSGTASIFDDVPPAISDVIAPCGSSVITFQASEQVKCSSIAADGSDFLLSGPGGPYTITAASGINCGSGTSQISFTISPALSGVGPWTIGVQTGTDGNSLTDACGNVMASQTKTFVSLPPSASITGPNSVCKGGLISLTASYGSSYNWIGSAVPAGQANQQSISFTHNTAGTLNFTVAVTNGTCGVAMATKEVTVNDGPVADFNVVPSFTVCAGVPVTFTNTTVLPCTRLGSGINICNCGALLCDPTPINSPLASYVWTFGDGSAISYPLTAGSLHPTHTYTSPGVYNVNLTSATGGGLGSCPSTINKAITVLPSVASLTVSPSVTVCPGTGAVLSASGGLTYTWTPSDGLSSINTATTMASPTITTVYTVSAAGCTSNTSQTVAVVVSNTPPVIGSINGPASVCPNVNNVSYSVNDLSGTTYSWTLSSGFTLASTSHTTAGIVINVANTSGTLTVSATNACGTSTTVKTISITDLSLTVSASPTIVCSGNPTSLSAFGASNYTWAPAVTAASTTGSLVTANPTTPTVYTVTGTAGVCTGVATITIAIAPSLSATITQQTNASCYGLRDGSASVSAPSVNGPYLYSWSTVPTQTTQTATGLGAGTYSVTVTSTQCSPSGTELINNGDFSLGNTGFSSAYTYATSHTGQGQYWVGNNANPWSPFLVSGGDHTTGSGDFMLVDGASTANVNVYCQTVSVKPNTNYLFSTWLTTLNNNPPSSQLAQLQFYVNGIPLGNVFTAPPTYSVWAQFFSAWNSGANTSANICIVNQSTTSQGNDFGLDDISFQECVTLCPVTKIVTITQPPAVPISVSTSTSICPGQSTALSVSGALSYTWSPSASVNSVNGTSVTANPLNTTIYTVTGTDASSCQGAKTVTVVVNPRPAIGINSPSICAGQSVILTPNSANSYTWAGGPTTNTFVVNPSSSTVYTVAGTSNAGCVGTQTTLVTVYDPQASFTGMNNAVEQIETLLTLQNTSTGANNISWKSCYNSTLTTPTLALALSDTGTCCVTLYAYKNTCTDSVKNCVRVLPKTLLEVPNVFTPNGDGHNDVFKLTAVNIGEINMTIYDRWGLKVFDAKSSGNIKWDGTTTSGSAVSEGTYFYVLKASSLDGKAYDLKGTINVFR